MQLPSCLYIIFKLLLLFIRYFYDFGWLGPLSQETCVKWLIMIMMTKSCFVRLVKALVAHLYLLSVSFPFYLPHCPFRLSLFSPTFKPLFPSVCFFRTTDAYSVLQTAIGGSCRFSLGGSLVYLP